MRRHDFMYILLFTYNAGGLRPVLRLLSGTNETILDVL